MGTRDSVSMHMPHSSTMHSWILSHEDIILGLPAVAHVQSIICAPDFSRAHRSACEISCMGVKISKSLNVKFNGLLSIYENSVLNKRHHLEALWNKYKDLYEFIPQSLEMMLNLINGKCTVNLQPVSYCTGKLVRGKKENSDWFSERYEFGNTDR